MKKQNAHTLSLTARTDPHRHFCCLKCENVVDIEIEGTSPRELEGH